EAELKKIKNYLINPIEAQEASFTKPASLEMEIEPPADVPVLKGFIQKDPAALREFLLQEGLAMNFEDLLFCQDYFKNTEQRDPTYTEIKVIDTYWSDHCRHTTFLTEIEKVDIMPGKYTQTLSQVFSEDYTASRSLLGSKKALSLMDIATIAMKHLAKEGYLDDLDASEEINACSIKATVEVELDGKTRQEDWLIMFKNETHNHPTEIEPFGGAATCLGGCIRDPLSGRAYVYQAMRITGSGDPRTPVEATLPGKLPQRKITVGALKGYSSYGNQIGLATGQVAEIYDEGFIAKRMEIGAVIAAAPNKNVVRHAPTPGDVVILVGGRTGRDGCGGATGSSKEHTKQSLQVCEAEVQKGNAVTERKIQRLFRKKEVSTLIKRCNDFGAGGVSVAIGELTDSLKINLDAIPKKYEGLDGTELAISESQERMAVVVAKGDAAEFIRQASLENLEATIVADVTDDERLQMFWRGKDIVNLSRQFLNTNGVKQQIKIKVAAPSESETYFDSETITFSELKAKWLATLADLNICSQKGMVEHFDSSIGSSTVLMPFGGKYQLTPPEGMAAKVPVLNGETTTGTIMAYGYNPKIFRWSPFHGAVYSVVEALTKVTALGGDFQKARLTFQEYFEKLGQDSEKWGKPFSALCGAYPAHMQLKTPAIGGKDSMSGTFKDFNLTVPPVLAAFAVLTCDVREIVSPEFKKTNSQVVFLKTPRGQEHLPDFAILKRNLAKTRELIQAGRVLAAHTVKYGGIAAALTKMSFGNKIGFEFTNFSQNFTDPAAIFSDECGSLLLELSGEENLAAVFGDTEYLLLGHTQAEPVVKIENLSLAIEELLTAWQEPLAKIFPTQAKDTASEDKPRNFNYTERNLRRPAIKIARPKVFIPVFPGTNCEYDLTSAFEKSGAKVDSLVIRNFAADQICETVEKVAQAIKEAQILMLSGGFSAGDEPDGSGKFIAVMLRNPLIKEAIDGLLNKRDGLILGICNGFQALIKLGLLPTGKISDLTAASPTLTYNKIGRHISCMVKTKVTSLKSPWFSRMEAGEIFTIPASHGEGRFYASAPVVEDLAANGQIAAQYVDFDGNASNEISHNPNGSYLAIEAITSPDGRVMGKMGHTERIGSQVAV
ncbi:MAG: phosphoribosylformylglycinamidine synthase, partial [Sporomusaceae bacterium]|nr:phosphoribosylformylglycinamidine synthase [Sporomusaceae bacterium]